MSDKEKIKEEIERLYKHYLEAQEFDARYNMALDDILEFINSLPDEPTVKGITWEDVNTLDTLINQVRHDFSNGISEKSFGIAVLEKFQDYQDDVEEPASEDKSEKKLAESYLAVFDKKYPILPTLKGKQKAEFKNFLNKCQQEFGLKEFGIHPTQSKLFEKLTLLWATWGAEHLEGLGKSNQDEFDKEPASEDLEEAADKYAKEQYPWQNGYEKWVHPIRDFIAGAEWQKQQMIKDAIECIVEDW